MFVFWTLRQSRLHICQIKSHVSHHDASVDIFVDALIMKSRCSHRNKTCSTSLLFRTKEPLIGSHIYTSPLRPSFLHSFWIKSPMLYLKFGLLSVWGLDPELSWGQNFNWINSSSAGPKNKLCNVAKVNSLEKSWRLWTHDVSESGWSSLLQDDQQKNQSVVLKWFCFSSASNPMMFTCWSDFSNKPLTAKWTSGCDDVE